MADSLLHADYRLAVVDHPVGYRIICPRGSQNEMLNAGLSKVARALDNEKLAARYGRALARGLTEAAKRIPVPEAKLVASRAQFRDVVRESIKAADGTLKVVGQIEWVQAPAGKAAYFSDFLIIIRKLGDALADACFGGIDPSIRSGRWKKTSLTDCGRVFRMKSSLERQPRTQDPRVWDRLRKSLEDIGAPSCFPVMGDIARYAGKRGKQIRGLTLLDAYSPARDPLTVMFPTKGGTAEHDEEGYLPETIRRRLDEWVDGPRARITGVTLADIRRMARDPRRVHELLVPLFTEDGVNPVSEGRLQRVIRKAAVAADIFFDTEEFRLTSKRKYVTFHYLRHEYVHRRLDAIMELPPEERELAKEALIATMNWSSGRQMLAWYSKHHRLKIARHASHQHNLAIDETIGGQFAPLPRLSPVGQGKGVDDFIAELC